MIKEYFPKVGIKLLKIFPVAVINPDLAFNF